MVIFLEKYKNEVYALRSGFYGSNVLLYLKNVNDPMKLFAELFKKMFNDPLTTTKNNYTILKTIEF